MFSPGKFIKNFDRYENVIKKYSPESFQNMKELRDVSATAMKDLSKKNANLMDLAVSGGLSGAGGIIGSAGVAVPNTFSFMMAKSMMNPTGWAKKWLTEGIKFSPSNAIKRSAQTNVLQIGGRNAFQEEDE